VPLFVDNVDAIVSAIGIEDVGLVWGLANTPWQSADDRDKFLDAITKQVTE
jgi:2C-methyl-D-erythritol 2,4-cyclodiphosphate synthase